MEEKYIEYILVVDNFCLPKVIEYEPGNNIKKVIITNNKNTSIETDPTFAFCKEKSIKFIVENVTSEEEAKNLVKDELQRIVNLIALDINLISGLNAYFKKSNLQSNGNQMLEVTVIKSDIGGYKKLENDLLDRTKGNDTYDNIYKLILSSSDEISKFILLYSILLLLIGNQKDVDIFIENELNKNGMKIEYRKSTKYEFNNTIYTWLRNEIGHTTKKSDINEIKDLIDRHIETLDYLVKIAMDKEKNRHRV
ncbi:hypothetical protein [Clostridium beijerinckii]|uniref:hypothetical protein n=1 Tax=Clostridium beijerinckii TaxID=1520 RepID=UPI00098C6569|nr:hypothetical protein [Clostridium beijerinckii]MBA8937242.1 hypothetical protein [Clostridium beijerinckii]NRU40292.1 hypothetical protein [Clostridium beijerinckii]NSA96431.1 hypothetical protein [Clostridium beijerinckii]OOM60662.1 hypothetical protein CLOBI_29500 [Clostridium beijerinckii]OOM68584.1 hypothetical protein CLBEIC_32410 [Clostridium beijerinckii]